MNNFLFEDMDNGGYFFVEADTIEDLIALREQYQHDIILTEDYDLDSESDVRLLVYDDYVE